jgi:hypothetical protein
MSEEKIDFIDETQQMSKGTSSAENNQEIIIKQKKPKKKSEIDSMKDDHDSLTNELRELKEMFKAQTELEYLKMANMKYIKEAKMDNIEYSQDGTKVNPRAITEPLVNHSANDTKPLDTHNNQNYSRNDLIGSSQTNDNWSNNDITQPKKKSNFWKYLLLWAEFLCCFLVFSVSFFLLFWKVFNFAQITSYILGVVTSTIITILIFWIVSLFMKRKLKKKKIKIIKTDEGDIKVENMDVLDVKKCPLCSGKILKGKVKRSGDFAKQLLKCSNVECDFKKELAFRII